MWKTGWLNSSVNEFLKTLSELHSPEYFTDVFGLITSLDSNDELWPILKHSPWNATDASRKGLASIWLSSHWLLQSEFIDKAFFGFDEVWFFKSSVYVPKPDISIVGLNRITNDTVEKLAPWLYEAKPLFGVGDGDGLNILLNIDAEFSSRLLFKTILELSMKQEFNVVEESVV